MTKPVILSTDPGIDDAVAISILLFDPQVDVKLIAAAAGNVGIEQTLNNVLKLEKFLGKKVPVVEGCKRALIKAPVDAASVHGKSGMDGYDFPEPDLDLLLKDTTAPEAIHKVVANSSEKVTLVGIAPLTDFALYIRLYPEDLANIEELVLMGGCIGRGNYGIYSEFNIAGDPEAAKIVFESGLKIRVAPLELGFQALVKPEISEQIKSLGSVGDMFYSLFKRYRGGSFNTGLKIYDALAAGILLNPTMFDFEEAYVDIITDQGPTNGASLMDFNNKLNKPANALIGKSVNVDEFIAWFIEAIKKAC
ncbi:MAG: nucleoside hydrolase [Lactobacillus apis]|uniref:nucleoside hydrolase n=1 Tax=Lactobacillus TaxID=1578 RepID=UPI000D6B15F3|nr:MULTISPECIES: nucleoside hydrolase [Lactobacillus]AWM73515.1 ribonucleoside hydrolase RihC [Lactobacillus apis]MCO6529198.1 nucleoside hydrolase [Lactobacillus sp.]MCT6822015.1 nucleoside hydrolase [Lactobacillus apis]MCT6876829.1 nucleoside hydrolase [Lactobacillus apis]